MGERWNELKERLLDSSQVLTAMAMNAIFIGVWLAVQLGIEKLIEFFHPEKLTIKAVVWGGSACEALTTLTLLLSFTFQDMKKSYQKISGHRG